MTKPDQQRGLGLSFLRSGLTVLRSVPRRLFGLRAGDWVEVRSVEEVLASLDDRASVGCLPFMPEMVEYCGRRYRIYKSAHKACDTIGPPFNRRMDEAVHLEGVRCSGEGHGGCQAGCLLYWKLAWVTPVNGPDRDRECAGRDAVTCKPSSDRYDVETLVRAAQAPSVPEVAVGARYRCQATELRRATAPLQWWDLRQYVKDLVSRNVTPGPFIGYAAVAAFNAVMHLHRRGRPYPHLKGLAGNKTPTATLDLRPGELVQVRSKEEIFLTLNAKRKNRGLSFDVEMIPFCGGTFRVLRRVEKIIDEKTGSMMRIPGDCIILENVTCGGCLSHGRLFCPRSIYPFWREIWLKRVDFSG